MIEAWMFFFGCVLCLMFLGMLYGERFSLVGLFDGRWLEPVARLFGDAWAELARGIDDVVEFVTENASWVVAAASGTAGLSMIAFLMFSGIADDAGAVHRDESIPLQRGGVLDTVPEITAKVPPGVIRLASARLDDSNFVKQQPGGIYTVFGPPRPPMDTRPLPELEDIGIDWQLDRADLQVTFDRSRLSLPIDDDEEITISRGRLIESPPISLLRLQNDRWRLATSSYSGFRNPLISDTEIRRDPLPESTVFEERDLESRVRIYEGDTVGTQNLRVEKAWPREVAAGEIELAITVLNIGDADIRGVLVRELLPWRTDVLDVSEGAVFRDGVVTWLVEELPPFEERLLRCVVRPTPDEFGLAETEFESRTEVSAATSVTSPITVKRRTNTPEFPPTPRIPTVIRKPEVRLEIEEPLRTVEINETVEVYFNVSNIGDAPAEGVRLRVTLDQGLDHHTLEDDDIDRRVENGIRRIEAGDTRRVVLRMRATQPGQHFATAEMIFEGAQLTLSTFQIIAEEPLAGEPTF